MIKKTTFCSILLAALTALVACQKEVADPDMQNGCENQEVLPADSDSVYFVPAIAGLEFADDTKSILGTDIESKFSGYQVIAFDKTDGVFVKAYSYPSVTSASSTVGMKLNKSHTYDFYIIGNLWYLDESGNKKSYEDLFAKTGTYPASPDEMTDPLKMPYYLLDGKTLDVVGYRTETFAECATYGIPFAGVANGITSSSLDAQGQFDITVKRLFAKETITVDHFGLDGGLGANIFKNSTLYLRQVNCRLHPFITNVCAQNNDDILDVSDYYATMSNDQATKFILYVPENAQGSASGTAAQKIPANAPSGKSTLVTFVEFKGIIDKSAGGYGGNMLYQYCLGANATSDYNVVRNTNYGVTLAFEAGSLFSPYWKVSCTDTEGMPVDTRKLGLCKDTAGNQMLAENNQPIFINRLDTSWFSFYVYFNKDGHTGLNQYTNHIDAYNANYKPGNVTRSAVGVEFPTIPGVDWTFDAATGKISFKVSDASQFVEGQEYDLKITLYAVSGVVVATYTAKITLQVDEYYVTDVSVSPSEVTAAGGNVTITGGKVFKKVTDKFGEPLPDQDMGDATYSLSAHSLLPSVTGSISGRTVTIPSLAKNVVAAGTYTLTASYGSLEKTCVISQGANSQTFYNPEVSLSYSPSNLGAAGGDSNPTVSYSQKVTYTSGSEESLTTGGTVSYSGSATGFTLDASTGKVTAAANEGTARSINVTAKVSMNGKDGTKMATVTQDGDSITSYSDPEVSVSYSPSTIGAAGGTASPTVTYKQTVTYASGKTVELTTDGTISYSGSATGFTLGTDGKVTASANEGTARSIEVTVSVTLNGKTGTKKVTVSQSGDEIDYYDDPVITFSYDPASIGAAGGTATPSCTYTQTAHYKSGKQSSVTTGGTITYSGSATGFTLAADGKVTASANTGLARSIEVTASVTVNGKTSTKKATVSQDADSVSSYGTPTVTLSYSPSTIGAEGGSASPTVSYSQVVTYASGNTTTVTSGASSITYSGSASGFTVASNGTVTAGANTGSTRSVEVTATVTVNGKSGSGSATVSQSGDTVTSYGTPTVTLSYSPTTIGASGGSSTASVSYSQTVTYASGTTTTVTSGGSVSFSGSATGFSLNSTNGTVTASENTGSERSITVTATVTLNGKSGQNSATVKQEEGGGYIVIIED